MIMFENVFIAENCCTIHSDKSKKKLFYYLIVPKVGEKKKLQIVSTCVNKSGDMILF